MAGSPVGQAANILGNALIPETMQRMRMPGLIEQEQRRQQVGNINAARLLSTPDAQIGTPETKSFMVNGRQVGQAAPADMRPLLSRNKQIAMFSQAFPEQSREAQFNQITNQLFPQPVSPVALAQGSILTNPRTGETIASNPTATKEFEPTNMQIPGTDRVVMARTPQEFDAYSQRGFVKSGTSIPGAKSPEKPKDPFDSAKALRSEFFDANKEFVKIRDSYGRIISSAREPSAAGDLALIFNFMKMLDPGSTVREGEFANAQNAGGVNDRTRAWYNNVLRGERLTEAQRSDFLSKSTGIFNTQKSFYDETVKRYSNLAERSSIPAADVVYDMTAGLPSLGVAAPQAGGSALASAPNIPRPQTQSDFDALPRGSVYIDPDDGKPYRKM